MLIQYFLKIKKKKKKNSVVPQQFNQKNKVSIFKTKIKQGFYYVGVVCT